MSSKRVVQLPPVMNSLDTGLLEEIQNRLNASAFIQLNSVHLAGVEGTRHQFKEMKVKDIQVFYSALVRSSVCDLCVLIDRSCVPCLLERSVVLGVRLSEPRNGRLSFVLVHGG